MPGEVQEIIIFSFTPEGTRLNEKLRALLTGRGRKCAGYAVSRYACGTIRGLPGDMGGFIGEHWGRGVFLFIGAAGIAVRYISPWVKDKFTDSAVLVMDEKGRYIIPLLSGHMGGAAAFADEISAITGAVPVHTTATDVQKKFAVDVFAKNNHLYIADRERAKEISAAVLRGEKIGFYAETECEGISGIERIQEGDIPEEIRLCDKAEELSQYKWGIVVTYRAGTVYEAERKRAQETEQIRMEKMWGAEKVQRYGKCRVLRLFPVNITAGIGCRRGISLEEAEKELRGCLKMHGLGLECLEAVASIDLKKDEPALNAFSRKYKIPFFTYCAEELAEVEKVSTGSGFVEKITGIDNVCERAALFHCKNGRMIQPKTIRGRLTVALAERPLRLQF